jgi:hypothetical protein
MLPVELLPPSREMAAGRRYQYGRNVPSDISDSSYEALLTLPLSRLVGKTPERADVASVAILGYN